jgi:2-methylcitrate dehydratase PrpD
LRIICKEGPLDNPADRDHCLQYMIAVALLEGTLTAEHYEDAFHRAHPAIDRLRLLMQISEDPAYSRDYLDADKRSIANAIQVAVARRLARPSASRSSTRSAIAAGALTASRCWARSSPAACAHASPRRARRAHPPGLWRAGTPRRDGGRHVHGRCS